MSGRTEEDHSDQFLFVEDIDREQRRRRLELEDFDEARVSNLFASVLVLFVWLWGAICGFILGRFHAG